MRFFQRDRTIDERTLDAFLYPGKDDGVMLSRERFMPLLDKYYELSGWDVATGWPARAKLEELGLGDVADVLQSEGRLG